MSREYNGPNYIMITGDQTGIRAPRVRGITRLVLGKRESCGTAHVMAERMGHPDPLESMPVLSRCCGEG